MPLLIDSSVWVHFTRARSPRALKQMIVPYIMARDAVLAEPIIFEVLRYATDGEARVVQTQFALIPCLATPSDIWARGALLGQKCRRQGVSPGGLDLLIATIALVNDAEVVTFDGDFEKMAQTCNLRVKLLERSNPA